MWPFDYWDWDMELDWGVVLITGVFYALMMFWYWKFFQTGLEGRQDIVIRIIVTVLAFPVLYFFIRRRLNKD